MSGPSALTIDLEVTSTEPLELRATFRNTGEASLALAFWWNRTMRVTDGSGRVIAPGPGPVLPCGVEEEWTVLAPGAHHQRDEPLACTQPAGVELPIGWSYDLPPGRYTVVLIYEQPAAHGFTQAAPHPAAFAGRVESNPVVIEVPPAPRRGLLGWLRS